MRAFLALPIRFLVVLTLASFGSDTVLGQAGLRTALEKLDRNEDGEISPDEITPLARPYLERIARSRRMSLDQPNRIDKLQEAARIHYALQNGVAGRDVRPESKTKLRPFGPARDEPIVPEFGLREMKYRYTQEDLDQADRTIRRNDKNEDGLIDPEEAASGHWTHRNPFEMDQDGDDRLSRLELAQRYARRRMLSGASQELVQKARRVGNGIRPSKDDEDKRGGSQSWRRGSHYWLGSTVVQRFDRNRNGQLEANESQSLGIPIGRIDVNNDSIITREEMNAYLTEVQEAAGGYDEGLPAWFYERDLDRDRQVSMAEFTDEWTEDKLAEFTRLDINQDGLITGTELAQAASAIGGSYRNDEAQPIPPRKSIISEIEVEDDFLIGDLNLRLSITHTYTSYLDAYLTGPDGQRIELFTEIGGSDDHFDGTLFDDQSPTSITRSRPPFKGTFQPEGLAKRQPGLYHFNGKSIRGVWQLTIRASRSDRFGLLHGWSLEVKPKDEQEPEATVASPTAPPATPEPPRSDGGESNRGDDGRRYEDYRRRGR